jgi:hypothetical protein
MGRAFEQHATGETLELLPDEEGTGENDPARVWRHPCDARMSSTARGAQVQHVLQLRVAYEHRLLDNPQVKGQEQSSEVATATSGPKSHDMALGHRL